MVSAPLALCLPVHVCTGVQAYCPKFIREQLPEDQHAGVQLEPFWRSASPACSKSQHLSWQVAPLLALFRSKTLQLYSLERLFLRSLLKRNGTQQRKVRFDGARSVCRMDHEAC